MEKPIRTCKSSNDVLERLKSEIFSSYYSALCFAACVGFQAGDKRPIEKPDKSIEYYLFKNFEGFEAIFLGIAMADIKTREALGTSEESFDLRRASFEAYANGGLHILGRIIEHVEEDQLPWELAGYVARHSKHLPNQPPDEAPSADEFKPTAE